MKIFSFISFILQDGKAEVIANDLGDRVTPCVVAFTDIDMVRLNLFQFDFHWHLNQTLSNVLVSLLLLS